MTEAKQSIEQRLARLEDERAIETVIKRLAWAGDSNRRDEWLDCFTDDARLDFKAVVPEMPSASGDVRPINVDATGREQLAKFYDSVTRRPNVFNKHFLADQIIAVDGDTATAQTYIALVLDIRGTPQLNSTGRYFDKLRRGADGRWRLTERVGRIDTRVVG